MYEQQEQLNITFKINQIKEIQMTTFNKTFKAAQQTTDSLARDIGISYYVNAKNEEIEVEPTENNAIALINVGSKQTQAHNDWEARKGLPFEQQSFRVKIEHGKKPVLMPFYEICKNFPEQARKIAERELQKNKGAFKKWEFLYNFQKNFKA
jgi:hypothetical protein